jgi:hypothetical protein
MGVGNRFSSRDLGLSPHFRLSSMGGQWGQRREPDQGRWPKERSRIVALCRRAGYGRRDADDRPGPRQGMPVQA